MPDEANLETLRRLVTAFAINDENTIRSLVTPDVVWHVAGRTAVAGDYKGIDAMLNVVRLVVEMTDGTLEARLHDVLANERHGVILLKEAANRNGKRLEYELIDLYHFREGLICEMWSTATDQQAFDEFFA
jgi:ketosteroid isomerase-like protein